MPPRELMDDWSEKVHFEPTISASNVNDLRTPSAEIESQLSANGAPSAFP